MIPDEVPIVCVAAGRKYPDVYVVRLESMLRRHMPVPFTLTCIVDGPRALPPSIRQIDATEWGLRREGMKATTLKLGLFDPALLPFDEFIYLDTTIVIHRDMTEFLAYGFGREEEMVIIDDWNYDSFNSCVMRIRTGGALAAVPEAFREGVEYPQKVKGDQEFVTAYVRDKGLGDRVAFWPQEMIVGFQNARKLNRTDPAAALAMLDRATIVKFFGYKPHEMANPFFRVFRMWLSKSWRRNRADAFFWARELRELWR